MNSEHFADLSLSKPILRALAEEGYQEPTPIQQAAIPQVLAGRDLLATAQTGTGKTAAFSLPMLQLLGSAQKRGDRVIRALILTPTRELALQIDESFRNYGRHLPLRTAVVLGGVPLGGQIRALRQKPDILVATPGRLLDLMQQGYARLDRIDMLVLDEADRMLDMGFIRDVRRIVAELPRQRQTMFFSATLPPEIAQLAADMLRDPAKVAVTPAASVSGQIAQKVLFVEQSRKRDLLADVLKGEDARRTLVFTRTKRRADRLAKQLSGHGISVDAIHSNKSQNARQRALAAFDGGRIEVLIATDIVARGIDVDGISHVINYELPNDAESYVHRIGRTARAGAEGVALTFCDAEEVPMLRKIERLTRSRLTVVEDHGFHSGAITALSQADNAPPAAPKKRGNGGPKRGPGQSASRHRNSGDQRSHKGRSPARSGSEPRSEKPISSRRVAARADLKGAAETISSQPRFGRRSRPAQ